MNEAPGKEKRRLIPRWRSSRKASDAGEIEASRATARAAERASPGSHLVELEGRWRERQDPQSAAELVSGALAFDALPVGRSAAEALVRDASTNPLAAGASAILLRRLGVEVPESFVEERAPHLAESSCIGAIKKLLRLEPRNPILLVDLARHYVNLGQKDRAENFLDRAVKLRSDSRFVLRAASRFLVHKGATEKALDLLRRYGQPTDPWILAAEISIATILQLPSRNQKQAVLLSTDEGLRPRSRSELSAALASQAYDRNEFKRARQFFRAAMFDPSDNVVAQLEWATTRLEKIEPSQEALGGPFAFEARARRAFTIGQFALALQESLAWLEDEPFSSRPATYCSFIASLVLEDFELGAECARRGLIANPSTVMLRNNLAYALACQGRLADAEAELKRIHTTPSEHDAFVVKATEGLLLFRRGFAEEAVQKYKEAIASAEKEGDPRFVALCRCVLARERNLVTPGSGEADLAEVQMKLLGVPPEDRRIVEAVLAREQRRSKLLTRGEE